MAVGLDLSSALRVYSLLGAWCPRRAIPERTYWTSSALVANRGEEKTRSTIGLQAYFTGSDRVANITPLQLRLKSWQTPNVRPLLSPGAI